MVVEYKMTVVVVQSDSVVVEYKMTVVVVQTDPVVVEYKMTVWMLYKLIPWLLSLK